MSGQGSDETADEVRVFDFVVLDTTVLRQDIDLSGLDFDYLKSYAARFEVRVLVPEVVRREAVRYVEDAVEGMVDQAAKLRQQLKRHGITDVPAPPFNAKYRWRDVARGHLESRLSSLGFEVLPLPPIEVATALDRLFRGQRPFGRAKSGSDRGLKDYLIWESVLALSADRSSGQEPLRVALLTGNSKDFAAEDAPTALHADLRTDAARRRLDVTLFGQLREFSDQVARPALPAIEAAELALARESVTARIKEFVREGIRPDDVQLDTDREGIIENLLEAVELSDLDLDPEERDEWTSTYGRQRVLQRIGRRLSVEVFIDEIEEVGISGPFTVTDLGDDKIAVEFEAELAVLGSAFGSFGYGSASASVSEFVYIDVGVTLDISGPAPQPEGVVTLWP